MVNGLPADSTIECLRGGGGEVQGGGGEGGPLGRGADGGRDLLPNIRYYIFYP